MLESINERKFSDEGDERRDLLSNLVNANDEHSDSGGQRLGEAELIGMDSTLGLPANLLTYLLSREHVHFLPGWTRGEYTLTDVRRWLITTIDVWTHPIFRLEHARGAPRTTRGVVPTHSRCSPRWPPTSKRTTLSRLGIQGPMITSVDSRRHPEA